MLKGGDALYGWVPTRYLRLGTAFGFWLTNQNTTTLRVQNSVFASQLYLYRFAPGGAAAAAAAANWAAAARAPTPPPPAHPLKREEGREKPKKKNFKCVGEIWA